MSGHGTSVAAIAAGNGRGSVGGIYAGVAPESELLIVKLGNPRREGFPRTNGTDAGCGLMFAESTGISNAGCD